MTEKSKQSASGSFAKLMQTDPSKQTEAEAKEETRLPTNDTSSTAEQTNGRAHDHAERPNARTQNTSARSGTLIDQIPGAPKERKPERYSFQFWDDQIVRLKRLRQIKNIVRDPYERKEITMSDMVRQAIDDYLDKQTKQIKQSERTVV